MKKGDGPVVMLEQITRKAEPSADGTYSTADLCRLSGRSLPYVRDLLREALAAGLWETIHVPRVGLDGRRHKVIAYRPRKSAR